MMNSSANLPDVRLALPEIIPLDLEQCDRARQLSYTGANEDQRWQTYLNALALLGLEHWLNDHLRDRTVSRHPSLTESICYLRVDDFKLCLIATEHVLDEIVIISQDLIEQTDLAADCYVLLEVLEEQAQIMIRGVIHYDSLLQYCQQTNLLPSSAGNYQLPFDLFDSEPNHLLFYCQFLQPRATLSPAIAPLQRSLSAPCTRLSQWFQNVFDEGWLTLDRLIHPEVQFALNLRNPEFGTKRGKLINLGIEVGTETVVLLVTITPISSTRLTVLTQLHPTAGKPYLTPNLKLRLYSKAGNLLQEVTSRNQDNYIQLKPFKGETRKRFSVEVSLGDHRVTEAFEF